MYEKFYGLRAKPFRLSPDPQFFFTSETHKSALAYLRYGLHQGEGFIVVTGAAGTGKTTLMRTLLGELSRRESVIGELVTTQLQPDDLLRTIAAAFHLDPAGAKSEVLGRLQAFFIARVQAGKRVLLVVDEAHNLPQNSFEELRMLSNFQQGKNTLLQCILLGQPPLRDLMARANMEQLQQRVIAAHHLHPLSAEETRGYILHRLVHAGWRGDPSFTSDAIKQIHRYSQGIPRRINSLCDRLLLFGYIEEHHQIDAAATNHVYGEWAVETSQTIAAEPLWQQQQEEITLAGLGSEDIVVKRAVGMDMMPLAGKPIAARARSTAIVQTNPPAQTRTASPVAAEPTPATTSKPPGGYAARLATIRQRPLKPIAGVAAALTVVGLALAFWTGKNPDEIATSEIAGEIAVSPPPTMPDINTSQMTKAPIVDAAPAPPDSQPSVEPEHAAATPQASTASSPQPASDTSGDTTHSAGAKTSSKTAKPRMTVAPHTDVATAEIRADSSAPALLHEPAKQAIATPTGADPAPLAPQSDVAAPVVTDKPMAQRAETATPSVIHQPLEQSTTAPAPVVVSAPAIAEEELAALLARFQGAYETGDMRELLRLFANDARSDDARDRNAIALAYQKLFKVTDTRQLTLKSLRWQEVGEAMRGEGQFGVRVREKSRGLESSQTGHISMRVEKRDGRVVITELHHSYLP